MRYEIWIWKMIEYRVYHSILKRWQQVNNQIWIWKIIESSAAPSHSIIKPNPHSLLQHHSNTSLLSTTQQLSHGIC